MADKTPQELGYEWDRELARIIQGQAHKGSGNRFYQKLDASGHELVVSGKHTTHASFSITDADLDEVVRGAYGPEAIKPDVIPILAVKLGTGRMVAALDLMQLIAWIAAPPELIPATKQDQVRATVKVPPYLR